MLVKEVSEVSTGISTLLPALTSLTNYLLCHEILEIVFVLGWCMRALTLNT